MRQRQRYQPYVDRLAARLSDWPCPGRLAVDGREGQDLLRTDHDTQKRFQSARPTRGRVDRAARERAAPRRQAPSKAGCPATPAVGHERCILASAWLQVLLRRSDV